MCLPPCVVCVLETEGGIKYVPAVIIQRIYLVCFVALQYPHSVLDREYEVRRLSLDSRHLGQSLAESWSGPVFPFKAMSL